ncbi:hypothetical protein FHR87_003747 [Azomonas macrocytogenes]|uniref:Uncharacterized protein n=1 Tax=Azomonas macrocytogenes TaxID=69962 RepID=A0A839T760_AZOMA|nr:hypothetical protein [Azomonas macrocytogenes]
MIVAGSLSNNGSVVIDSKPILVIINKAIDRAAMWLLKPAAR